MRTIFAITRKEFEQYFASPVAYIVVALFMLLCGVFFYIFLNIYMQGVSQAGAMGQEAGELSQSIVRPFLTNISFFFLMFFPILTMRLLAEEKKMGTYELLMTSPISVPKLVIGKYLGVLALMAVILLLVGLYPVVLIIFGHPDLGPIWTGFLGLFLLGAAFLAIGLFASSLTDSQIVAAVISFVFFLLFWIVNFLSRSDQWYGRLCQYVSIYQRFDDFTKGVLNLNDACYYISLAFFGLFATGIVLQSQRWKS